MEYNLFPANYEEEVITEEDLAMSEPFRGYLNGPAFDIATGDFLRDGKNRILDSDGVESWKNWCINCLQTERYSGLAYSTDFGISTAAAFQATSHEEAESILTREITEALLADPYERTAFVEDLEFDWTAPDTISVKAIIHGTEDVTIDIVAYLTRTS